MITRLKLYTVSGVDTSKLVLTHKNGVNLPSLSPQVPTKGCNSRIGPHTQWSVILEWPVLDGLS